MISKRFIFFFLISVTLTFASGAKAQINTDRVLIIGRNALYFEDYVLAISYFNKVIRVKPYLAEPYYLRAYAKYSLDDLKGAKKDMDKAIEISPFHAEFFSFRADIQGRYGAYHEAIDDFAKAIEIEPDNPSIYFNRGIIHMNMKKYEEAVEDYTSVLNIDKGQYGAYINRAIAHLNLKDTLKAVADMEEAITVNPLVADAHKFSAVIFYEMNDFDKALTRINEAIRLKQEDPTYYILRGVIRYQKDDLRGTMEDFDKVIELDPKNILAYSNRGLLRTEVGDVNNAIDDFSRVLAMHPNDLLTLFNRALLYLRVGQYNDAISDLSLIISYYPNYPDAYRARSQAYAALHRDQKAQQDYNMAYKLEQDRNKKAEERAKSEKDGSAKPKETRKESDDDINNHDKIAVLDDFGLDETEKDDIHNLRGKIQNKNIIVDLEPVYGLTFFSVDTLINRARYFKPEVTQFNQHLTYGRPLIFSNREVENDDNSALEYFKTIKDITNDLEKNPNQNKIRFVRAVYYTIVMNYSNAIADYDYIIQHQSGESSYKHFAYLNRAYVRYKMVEMMNSMEESDLPDNLSDAGGNNLLNNKQPVDKNKKVVRHVMDYELIEKDLNKVLEYKPDFEFAYYDLGILQCLKKNYKEALVDFNKAIELNPFFAEAYFNRGLTRIYLKDEEEGTLDLSKAGELGLYKAYNVIKRYGSQNKDQEENEKNE